MKIGIVFHSQSGRTRELAGMAAEALRARGHEADLLSIEPVVAPQPHQKGVELKSVPDCSGYDMLMVGGPIWAFGMSPVTMAFAGQSKALSGRRVMPFATMSFPFRFMGGMQGIAGLSKALRASGAAVLPGVVGAAWAKKSPSAKQEVVARILAGMGA